MKRREEEVIGPPCFFFFFLYLLHQNASRFFLPLFSPSVWRFNSRNELVLNWFYVLQMSDWCFIVILVGRFSQKALEKGLFSLTDVNEWESVSFNHAQWKLINYSQTGIYSHFFFLLLHTNMKSSRFKHKLTLVVLSPPAGREGVFIYLFVFSEKSIS